MMGIEEVLGGKREAILQLADKHGAYNVRVFGSVARGEAGPTSDVDLVVDVQPWVGLEFLGLWDELEDLLGRKVDLLTERALKSGIRERILREAVAL
jgi:predicted nucleotidyltransferase